MLRLFTDSSSETKLQNIRMYTQSIGCYLLKNVNSNIRLFEECDITYALT